MEYGKESNTKSTNKMIRITTYLSILTLNVISFNSPSKRHRMVNWITKEVSED
jgi:hypothetical protein